MVGKITITIPVSDHEETDAISYGIERYLCSTIGDDFGMMYKTISESDDMYETERALNRKQ